MAAAVAPARMPDCWPLQPGDPLPPPASDVPLDLSPWQGHWLAIAVATPSAVAVPWPADHERLALCVGRSVAPEGAAALHRDPSGATAQRWGAGLANGIQFPLLICVDPAGRVHSWSRLA